MSQSLAIAYAMKRKAKAKSMAMPKVEMGEPGSGDEIVERIMRKKYPDGVSNDEGKMADDLPNEFDDLMLGDDLGSTNSGAADGDLLGSDQPKDQSDMVSRIMRNRNIKQGNPRPA